MASTESLKSPVIAQVESIITETLQSAEYAHLIGISADNLSQRIARPAIKLFIGDSVDDWTWVKEVDEKHHLWLKDIIARMARNGQLEERPNPREKGRKLYHLPGHGIFQFLLDSLFTRDDVEREIHSELWSEDEVVRQRSSVSVLSQIAADHAREETFVREIRRAARGLAEQNPVELLLEMAQWVRDDINHLVDAANRAASEDGEKLQSLSRQINFRCIKARNFFQRLWRLDPPTAGTKGIMSIPTLPKMLADPQCRVTLDVSAARARLQERIIGDKVIELISVPPNPHRAAIGTDASVGDISLRHERGSFIPPTPAVLFVAAGAMHIRKSNGGIEPYWDFDVDPRELSEYDDLEAAERGYLISPNLRREAVTDFRHLRSAAMELRQYAQELRIVRNAAKWSPIGDVPILKEPPIPTLLIRDGRIFPLVHRIDDYDGVTAPDDALYGLIVRREIQAFEEVFQNTAMHGKQAPIYAGTVKSPEFSWFAMLTFWYLQVKCNCTQVADGFYWPPLNDQAVTHLLFCGLVDDNQVYMLADPRNMLITFRAVRHFADIAFPGHPLTIKQSPTHEHLVDETNEDDWITFIEQHIQNAAKDYPRRGIEPLPGPEDYRAFLYLCQHAGVAMFYAAPTRMYRPVLESHSHFLLPRWEITTEVTKTDTPLLQYRLERMLAWLIDEGGLVRDEVHATNGFEEMNEGLPFFVPDVIMQAHETVVYTTTKHVPDLEEKLQQIVQMIRGGEK